MPVVICEAGDQAAGVLEHPSVSDYAEFAYKCSDFYHPEGEGGIKWDDPDVGVEWPITDDMKLNLSERDTKWGGIKEL